LVFALRRLEGVNRAWFRRQTGIELDSLAGGLIDELVALRLMVDDTAAVRLTRDGLLVSDAVFSRILRLNSVAA
jgi:oxygen-independent coproporphyrinogen-3 oxidase